MLLDKLYKLFSVPRSLFYSVKLFGVSNGIRIPLWIAPAVKVHGLKKNAIKIDNIRHSKVFFGFGGSEGISANKSALIIVNDSIIVFKGNANFASGTVIRLDNGILQFGERFSCNKNCFISCSDKITFGDDCLLGWSVNIRDADGHQVLLKNRLKASKRSVVIGNHVWIASHVDILKGVNIPEGCVIGYRSCVTKSITTSHSLIVGYPAKPIQNDIAWVE